MKYTCVALLLLWSSVLIAQDFTDSNLPIVIIQIDNDGSIRDNPRVYGTMKVLSRGEGQRTYVEDQHTPAYVQYDGRISIEIRGSSSQNLPKKQYGLTTLKSDDKSNNNVSLLGMPSENDWILSGLAYDASLLRDYMSYNLMRKTGAYAPRTQYCEVVINGDYKGLYLLIEKIKADNNRVNVEKIERIDNLDPNKTGGYITKADKLGGDPLAWVMPANAGPHVTYVHHLPKPENVTSIQHNYIKDQFESLAIRATSASIFTGFSTVIDVKTFVDFMLFNELAANVDAYQISTYFHKDRGGKLRAGPIWDFNFTYGNDLFPVTRSLHNTWQFDNGDNVGSKFWNDLFLNPTFKCHLAKRFAELSMEDSVFNVTYIENFIDEIVALTAEAKEREHARWGTLENFEDEINEIKVFITLRSNWMKESLGSWTSCNTVVKPSLVISRIHYHPKKSETIADEELLEFVEVTNAGMEPVDLTGIHFSELGFSYQFPQGAILDGGSVVYIARDAKAFKRIYRAEPFGEYHRNLSNSSQKIVLSDAFGNVIDEVHYFDRAPWPDADGSGLHLKLKDIGLDNRLAENWIASDEYPKSTIVSSEGGEKIQMEVYPNPTNSFIKIKSAKTIDRIELLDMNGVVVKSWKVNSQNTTLDLLAYSSDEYVLMLYIGKKAFPHKIVKY